ncbi:MULTISPECIES: hypothetical protein [unclassified Acinetobacter]|uniref:hypothetical protein n=1 Tax=unclassified Acinetobacter TaxID=196816 RepID=UPI00244AAFE1|nr:MULTISPECIES: hypothetical protein [unclassified Acinetobacter]MDH0032014.1 hypothetical protein [Acinetobacter sp. GD04021]MDH0887670.1 hypothetical protein [Acinetobacter sp. GD03873]MDH1084018.1 hypothetical protein [Acinetobacter sp. GD03983]MDH2191055.1 hypothetical protein [Acinetobacter sp. GD03645]MDH2204530.1 hypothetical protein [Acinetobacter sp. GD03647]
MPKYLYQGEMGRISARTSAGPVVLPKGEEVEVTDKQHEALVGHAVFKALEDSSDLVITGVKKAKASGKGAGKGETDADASDQNTTGGDTASDQNTSGDADK